MKKLPALLLPLILAAGLAAAQDAQTPAPGQAEQDQPAAGQGTVAPAQPAPVPAPLAPPAPVTPAPTETAPAPSVPVPAVTPPAAPEPAAPAPVPATPVQGTTDPVTPGEVPAVTPPVVTEPAVTGPATPAEPAAPGTVPDQAPTPAAPQIAATSAEEPQLPTHDLSPRGMYEQADIVVRSVMIMLAAASFLTLTIFLYKVVELIGARARARASHRRLHASPSLASAESFLSRRRDPVAVMARAVHEEYTRSATALDDAGPSGLKERAASLIERIEGQALARIRRGTGILATIGSVGPFVGLFGTVWGIMNSFIGIAETKTTNLAVVAPGIAEALLATALGLVAAIPAVVIYNFFTRAIAGYRLALGDAGAAVLRHLSRDLDFRTTGER